MNIEEVKFLCSVGSISWTEHATKRMIQRGIEQKEVISCINHGEIIEEYPEDYPYPSCLIYGITEYNRVLHVVVSVQGNMTKILNIITSYEPDTERFKEDLKTRRNR